MERRESFHRMKPMEMSVDLVIQQLCEASKLVDETTDDPLSA